MRMEWTANEETYMERYYLSQPAKKTAEKLNRTIPSVKRKAAKMGLNHYTSSFNAKAVANCFNVDISVIKRWIEKFGLPCKKVRCDTQTRYIIDIATFWKWAEEHKDIINWSRYERLTMCPEPNWLEETIKNYNTPKSRNRFTEQEVVSVKGMLHRGLNYKEIALQMGRSYYSIKHLCRKIYR